MTVGAYLKQLIVSWLCSAWHKAAQQWQESAPVALAAMACNSVQANSVRRMAIMLA